MNNDTLTSKDRAVELDPNNPHHREWFEDDSKQFNGVEEYDPDNPNNVEFTFMEDIKRIIQEAKKERGWTNEDVDKFIQDHRESRRGRL